MRVTYIHQYFNTPEASGGTRSYELARRMVTKGHEVTVITSKRDRRLRSGWMVEDREGVRIDSLCVPYSNAMSYSQRLNAFARFAWVSALRASRISTDVVFATSTPLTVAIPGACASWLRHAPMVFEVRDLWPEVPIAMGAIRGRLPVALAQSLESFAYSRAHHIIALSPGMRDGITRRGVQPERISVVPNACDTDLFDVPAERGMQFREGHPWLGERPLVLYAGTLGRINAVHYLAEVATHSRKSMPDVRYLVVGGGAETEYVRTRAADLGVLDQNFFMLDALPKKDVVAAFSAATLSLSLVADIPELWANSANKFFDTLAAARPIAINYMGWQAEIIQRTGAGLVLPAADPAEAARQIHSFIASPSRQAMARNAARQLAYGELNRERCAESVLSILEAAAA